MSLLPNLPEDFIGMWKVVATTGGAALTFEVARHGARFQIRVKDSTIIDILEYNEVTSSLVSIHGFRSISYWHRKASNPEAKNWVYGAFQNDGNSGNESLFPWEVQSEATGGEGEGAGAWGAEEGGG